MVELPGDYSIRNKIAQEKVNSKQAVQKGSSEGKSAAKSAGQPSTSEQIVLSSKARNIQHAREIVKSSPEIRVDKVNRIKKEIAEGRFKVDSDVLAEKILKDIIETETGFLS